MTYLQGLPTKNTKPSSTVLIASADTSFRHKVGEVLEGLRWQVQRVSGGAEALVYLSNNPCSALILDAWLPDLDVHEVISECRRRHPSTDLLTQDMSAIQVASVKNARRQELWYAMRCGHDDGSLTETPIAAAVAKSMARSSSAETSVTNWEENREGIWAAKPGELMTTNVTAGDVGRSESEGIHGAIPAEDANQPDESVAEMQEPPTLRCPDLSAKLPEIVGSSPAILELCRQIRLVAPKKTSVLIEGPTGTGKELVARAVHRLSNRARRPFIVLNCAAIPEALLEAELFGYTKGSFTGATHSRTGRLEAAHEGTLFLDEIGEMPLALQAKLLRFLEQGELQRLGENDPMRVDARVIAATHQLMEQRVREGSFRADLYFRIAVFPLVTPALTERRSDIPELCQHFLRRLAVDQPAKALSARALERLESHDWPGGVRELEHVLERGYILAEERSEIAAAEIRFGSGR